MNHKMILVRGVPGSGKSTFARFLAQNLENEVEYITEITTDEYPGLYDSEGTFHPELLKKAHAWSFERAECFINEYCTAGNVVIIVHNTFTQQWEMQRYIDLAEAWDMQLISLVVENRHGNKSIHGVPDDHVQKMVNRFEIKLT